MDELLRITYMLTDPVVMISVGIYITNIKDMWAIVQYTNDELTNTCSFTTLSYEISA